MTSLAERILHARLRVQLSQDRAAELANVSRSTWQRIESGRCQPRGLTAYRVAEVLELDPLELLELNDEVAQ